MEMVTTCGRCGYSFDWRSGGLVRTQDGGIRPKPAPNCPYCGYDATGTNERAKKTLDVLAMRGEAKAIRSRTGHGLMTLFGLVRPKVDRRNPGGLTPLMVAAMYGEAASVEALLDAGSTIDLAGDDGMAAIYVAAHWCHPSAVDVLLRRGAKTGPTASGTRPVDLAIRRAGSVRGQDCDEVVRVFLDHGIPPDEPNSDGRTMIHEAAKCGETEAVRLLLESGANMLAPSAEDGMTSLHYAAMSGNLETLELLLTNGADLQTRTTSGATALHISAGIHNEELVEFFHCRGIPIDDPTSKGQTPLHWVAKSPIELDTEGGNASRTAELLLEKGANLDQPDNDGFTPLLLAFTKWGDIDFVKILLDQGADVAEKTKDGSTALHLAAGCWQEACKELLARGPEIDAVNDAGYTPLLCAAAAGEKSILERLLGQGAAADARTVEGETALDLAAQFCTTAETDWEKERANELIELLRKNVT